MSNCTAIGNSAGSQGGGASFGTLNNCTLTGNSALDGGGVCAGMLNNCIVYFNAATGGGTNYSAYSASAFNYSCTMPMPTNGIGNFTNAPRFVDQAAGNVRLLSNSPCINAGNNHSVLGSVDLDKNARIVGGTVDMGAFEFQSPTTVLSYAWAQQYGLATDGSADFLDTDGDHANNWQEWRASTVPTNAASVLRMLTPSNSVSGLKTSWQSVSGVTYLLERSATLGAQFPFSILQSNILGQIGSTSYTDTNVLVSGGFFYRVGVQ
jgi:hypothetical protein